MIKLNAYKLPCSFSLDNKKNAITKRTDVIRQHLFSTDIGKGVEQFIQLVPIAEKIFSMMIKYIAKKDISQALARERLVQLDPTLKDNASHQIENSIIELTKKNEQKPTAKEVEADLNQKTKNLFSRYFNPEKHSFLIENAIRNAGKAGTRIATAEEKEKYITIREVSNLSSKQIFHLQNAAKGLFPTKTNMEILDDILEAANSIKGCTTQQMLIDLIKKEAPHSEKVIFIKMLLSFKITNDFNNKEKIEKFDSNTNDVTTALMTFEEADAPRGKHIVENTDGSSSEFLFFLLRDGNGGYPEFHIVDKTKEKTYQRHPAMRGDLQGLAELKVRSSAESALSTSVNNYIKPVNDLIDEISNDLAMDIKTKNYFKDMVMLIFTQTHQGNCLTAIQMDFTYNRFNPELEIAICNEIRKSTPIIFNYNKEEKKLSITIDQRKILQASITHEPENLNLDLKIVSTLSLELGQNEIIHSWETREISVVPSRAPIEGNKGSGQMIISD